MVIDVRRVRQTIFNFKCLETKTLNKYEKEMRIHLENFFESFEFLWVMFFLPSKVNPFSGVFLVNLTGNKNLSKKSLCLYTYEYFL